MGCDIHFRVERYKGGAWVSVDKWTKDDGDIPYVSWRDEYYSVRSYGLFAILADVRNSQSLICEGERAVTPIDKPRGLPEDVCRLIKQESDSWGSDGHSHSWLTLDELLAFDWTQTAKKTGWVDATTYVQWDDKTDWPKAVCGIVSGARIQHISEDEMKKLINETPGNYWEKIEALKDSSVYCKVEWEMPYYRLAGKAFFAETLPRLLALGNPYEHTRAVFWFDN